MKCESNDMGYGCWDFSLGYTRNALSNMGWGVGQNWNSDVDAGDWETLAASGSQTIGRVSTDADTLWLPQFNDQYPSHRVRISWRSDILASGYNSVLFKEGDTLPSFSGGYGNGVSEIQLPSGMSPRIGFGLVRATSAASGTYLAILKAEVIPLCLDNGDLHPC
jgi:hypothetical protein